MPGKSALKHAVMQFRGISFSCNFKLVFINILLIKGDNTCKNPVFAFYRL